MGATFPPESDGLGRGRPRSSLVVRLLGPPRVERDGVPVVFDNRKTLALVALLAVEGHAQRRDSLAAMLWPEADRIHARGALRRVLASLRAAVGLGWLEVEHESLGLRAGAPGLWIDVVAFRQAGAACRGHRHPGGGLCPAGQAAFTEALGLHRGEFLAGFTLRDSPEFDHWQLIQAEACRGTALAAAERLVGHHVLRGEWDEAVSQARRWLSLDPTCEVAHRHLMQLFAWKGERGRALRQYSQCLKALAEELAAHPMPETVRLAEAIRECRWPDPPAPAAERGGGEQAPVLQRVSVASAAGRWR